MKPHAALSIILLVFLLITPVTATSLSIEVTPLSKSYRRFPIKVYWQPSDECTAEFNQVLKKTLDTAIIFLRKSVWRFMEEHDGQFDDMITLRLEYTDNPRDAQILVTGGQLDEGVAGETWIGVNERGEIIEVKIIYDCEVVLKPVVPAFNIVLHELLHGLGLGHTQFDKVGDQWEIMAESKRPGEPTIYASTLDLYALYQLWYKNYRGSSITLSKDLEFAEVKPYVVELEELKEIYKDLHEKYGVIIREVVELKDDLKTVMTEIKQVETSVTVLNSTVLSIQSRVTGVENEVAGLHEDVANLNASIGEVREGLVSVGATVTEHSKQLSTLSDSLSNLKADVDSLEASIREEIAALKEVDKAIQKGLEQTRLLIYIVLAVAVALGSISIFLAIRKK